MQFKKNTPIFRSFDEQKAKEFYLGFLDFTVNWENRFFDGAPLYMSIQKGECEIHLSEHYGDAAPGSAVRIHCDKIHEYHKILLAKKYKFANPGLEEQSWGCYEIIIKDPFRVLERYG